MPLELLQGGGARGGGPRWQLVVRAWAGGAVGGGEKLQHQGRLAAASIRNECVHVSLLWREVPRVPCRKCGFAWGSPRSLLCTHDPQRALQQLREHTHSGVVMEWNARS